jgi:putative acetyltransferase
MAATMEIAIDDPARPDVVALHTEHLADMHATSPAESVHALDLAGLLAVEVTFWTVRRDDILLGCGALKELAADHGEVKSMRTATTARGTGVATAMLRHLLDRAVDRGYTRISLETGSHDFFEPARRLYARHGFTRCGPFGDYSDDPNSAFFTREVRG